MKNASRSWQCSNCQYIIRESRLSLSLPKKRKQTHAGYGFLSESAPFARSLSDSGVGWVGPSPDVLSLFGDKIRAREMATDSGVPVVRGSGNLGSADECLAVLGDGTVRLPAIMKVRGCACACVREMYFGAAHRYFSSATTCVEYPSLGYFSYNHRPEICRVGPARPISRISEDERFSRKPHHPPSPPSPRSPPHRIVAALPFSAFDTRQKAAFGGGGRGMRIVRDMSQVRSLFDSCRREAYAAFGRDEVFLEEYWDDTKHLEVQVLGDGSGDGVVHLYERDCTVQSRHQKVIELAPARGIHPELRERLVGCAVALARGCSYRGAGTVEFLVRGELGDPANAEFVFMEVNPRVQVEHTVTEEATGIDIVQAQLLIAGGRTLGELGLTQDNVQLRRHAIQARITMMPGKGEVLDAYEEPVGEGVRCDSAGWYAGFRPNKMYDPLVGKVRTGFLIFCLFVGSFVGSFVRAFVAIAHSAN